MGWQSVWFNALLVRMYAEEDRVAGHSSRALTPPLALIASQAVPLGRAPHPN